MMLIKNIKCEHLFVYLWHVITKLSLQSKCSQEQSCFLITVKPVFDDVLTEL